MNNTLREDVSKLIDKYGLPPYIYTDPDRFISGETPVLYSGLYWDKNEIINGVESLLAGTWIASGNQVGKFEKKFANKIRDRYGIMVNSGSSANLILIASCKQVFEWPDDSEIIVSPVGFPTTIAPIPQNNLVPVFIDIEMDSLNFDINLIEEKITEKTVAIFLSPVLGNPPDIDKILEICEKYNLKLLLDSCDSLGSMWRVDDKTFKYLNEFAVASSHSLYASHTISTGQGGIITTSNPDIMRIARQLISWGRSCYCSDNQALSKNGACNQRFSKWLENYDGIVDHKYVFDYMGFNLHPLDLQGAIGISQLDKMDDIFNKRITNKNKIDYIFGKNIDGIKTIDPISWKSDPVWFGTPILCENKELKIKLVQYLEDNKIQTRNYFAGNLLLHKGYEHLGNWKDYPNANKVLDLVFFIGCAPFYTDKHLNYIDQVTGNFKNE